VTLAVEERAAVPPLANMSCRPSVTIVHPSDDPARQLLPALRASLPPSSGRDITSPQALLRSLGIATNAIPSEPARAARRLEALANAVPGLLDLPAVIPLSPGGALPDTVVRSDPLLAFALYARCSGPVWLGRRTPSIDVVAAEGGTVTVLVPPSVRDRILAAVDAPGWAERVLERAIALEATS
jgi:hypothetical protein